MTKFTFRIVNPELTFPHTHTHTNTNTVAHTRVHAPRTHPNRNSDAELRSHRLDIIAAQSNTPHDQHSADYNARIASFASHTGQGLVGGHALLHCATNSSFSLGCVATRVICLPSLALSLSVACSASLMRPHHQRSYECTTLISFLADTAAACSCDRDTLPTAGSA